MSVLVVGGGLAGLFTAHELIAAGVDDLMVVEKAETPGGVTRTIRRDGFTLEPAVGSLTLPHPHLGPILDRIGAEMVPADAAATTRQIFLDGRLITVPMSPRALLAPVVGWPAKLRAMAEPLVASRDTGDEESLAQFCRRRFGRRAGDLIAWLMASGVYAGDPERLSAIAAFPAMVGLEREAGSVIRGGQARRRRRSRDVARPRLHLPVGGMSTVARLAADAIGDRYRGGFEVEAIRREGGSWVVTGPERLRADAVILATGPLQAAAMVDEELAIHLGGSKSANVVVVGLGGRGVDVLPAGFGALIGPDEGMVSRGLLYESSYAPERAPEGSWLLKVIAGGSPAHSAAGDMAEVILGEAETLLGRDLDPTFTVVADDLPGIPQYEIGHVKWLEGLEEMLRHRIGLHVAGWGYRGVGVPQLASDAARVRRAVSGR